MASSNMDVKVSSSHNCGYCDKSFVRKCHLYRHIRSIHKIEPDFKKGRKGQFSCDKCGVRFTRKYSLYDHMRKQHKLPVITSEKTIGELADDQVMCNNVIPIKRRENQNTEEEKPLNKYRFKVYASTGRRGFADSEEYTSKLYYSFNEVYRALVDFKAYKRWSDLRRVTGSSIQIEGQDEVRLFNYSDICIDDLPKLDVTEAEFDKIIETINRELTTRGW